MLDELNPAYSRCVRCNCCDGFPCLVHAKGDAEVCSVRPALEAGNVSLLTRSHVKRLQDRCQWPHGHRGGIGTGW
jgi:choline dehydrogenase-like flavoprotein